ncbi:unnamed protein product, partial [Hymenolepis diminuta]
GHKEGFYRETSTNSSTRQNPNNKRALTQTRQSYDRHWLRYLMKKTKPTSTLEPTNAENLVRGCNQCLHVAKISHPSIHIQSPKPDSLRTQL